MTQFSVWDIFRILLMSARFTVALSLAALCGGAVLGVLLVLTRESRLGPISWAARAFGSLARRTPLLMQMFLAYFGLALFGFDVPAWLAAGTALVLWAGAFLGDIWWGCVRAVPRGQWEASSSLAMSYGTQMRVIIVPQAMRMAVPPTVGFCVQIVKSTAIASIVGFNELSHTGAVIMNATFEPFTVYLCTAAIYFVICWLLTRVSASLERKLHGAH